jgi:hypothetical protein
VFAVVAGDVLENAEGAVLVVAELADVVEVVLGCVVDGGEHGGAGGLEGGDGLAGCLRVAGRVQSRYARAGERRYRLRVEALRLNDVLEDASDGPAASAAAGEVAGLEGADGAEEFVAGGGDVLEDGFSVGLEFGDGVASAGVGGMIAPPRGLATYTA